MCSPPRLPWAFGVICHLVYLPTSNNCCLPNQLFQAALGQLVDEEAVPKLIRLAAFAETCVVEIMYVSPFSARYACTGV